MQTNIVITGAPGNVGTELVRQLKHMQVSFRVGARRAESAQLELGEAINVVTFDFLKPDTYESTFAGAERLFLVRPPSLANVQRDIAPAIHAATDAGIKHIVFLSVQGAEKNRFIPHAKIEQVILETGVDFTFLRAGFFMQNLSTTHREEIRVHDEISVPVGKAKTSFIDVRDIAAVAAHCLTQNSHNNKKHTLTGAEALTYEEIADKLSKVLDRQIQYTAPSVASFLWRWIRQGNGVGYALVVAGLYTVTRFGNAAEVTDDVETILQRSPILFDDFAEDYRHCWIKG